MSKADITALITGITSWAGLEARIANLPSEQQRGEVFEQFCKAFFLLDPVFQFKDVYRQNEISPSIREKLGYPGIQDLGIDGVGITHEGQIFAYQAKFRSDRKVTPSLRELSTFFTLSDKADWRITIANSNKLPSSIDERVRHSRVLSDRFDNLDSDFFDRLTNYLNTQSITPPQKRTPHETQKEAIEKALSHYEKNSRGQLILPCGSGKTLASIWISEKLGGKKILVMLPSLSLLSQTLREWAINSSTPFRYLCICSDTTVDLGNDAPIEKISDMDVPVTTQYESIRDFLNDNASKTSIVFSTYQSSKVLSQAVLDSGTTFDMGIFDEAHRTAGTKVGAWGIALDDENIPISKRLFMTATPKIYAPHITKKAKEEDVLLCSMDDVDVYGHPFCEIGFAEAVKRDHITDYKVIVICVTDSEVKKVIEQGGRVITDKDHEWDAKALAKRIALVKGIRAYGLRKAFTFHGKVASAKSFTDTSKPYGIDKIFDLLETEKQTKKSIGFFHVNGDMPSGTRSNILKEFESVDIGIMSNARCLVEGVNIPAVDTVAFIDPKRSLIDIVQATGRAMRKADWKENGYIFIPVVVDEDSDPEQIVTSSDFDTVWRVLQAMVDQDQRLQSIVENMRVMQGKREEDSQAWKDAMRQYTEKIDFYNLPAMIDRDRFINRLCTKIIEVIGRNWDFWYGLTLQFKDHFGDPNSPIRYSTPEGYNLGGWQNNQRFYYKKGKMSQDKFQRLDDIGFTWGPLDDQFEKGINETLKYKNETGDANAPMRYKTLEGYRLGKWQSHQRDSYKKGKISQDRIQKLEAIGFRWDTGNITPVRLEWDFWYDLTLKYKDEYGNPNTAQKYQTPDGYKLGQWQAHIQGSYRKGMLSQDRIQKLEAIGFVWGKFDEMFERGFRETVKYMEQTGDAKAQARYKTPEGYNLGFWQNKQRLLFQRGRLPFDRIQKLEAIGFRWDTGNITPVRLEWDFWYDLTLKYKDEYGDCKAPRNYETSEGYRLGAWQSHQRGSYKKGKISQDRIQKLEAIGFRWGILDEKFQKGFEETLKYKKETGDPNAPLGHTTPDGFKLGAWQNTQRTNHNNNKLSLERVERLEAINFKWALLDLDAKFEKGFQETLRYKEQTGDPNVPTRYRTPGGYTLGNWQTTQRSNYRENRLLPDRVQRLQSIGFKWALLDLDAKFEKGFQETLGYRKEKGNSNAPYTYKTSGGYSLGHWQHQQKNNYKKGKLSRERIQRLEDIGFRWSTRKVTPVRLEWDFWYDLTLKYKKEYDDSNAPDKYKTTEGYNLGKWQSHQKDNYRKGKLSPERILRLEKIGFRFGKPH
jgi:superfamily II DNA or RNA helicase